MSWSIAACLRQADQLNTISDSPRLDVEILLAHVLNKDRTYLFTWPERLLTAAEAAQFCQALERRRGGEPVAHITGKREFWSLPLWVDKSTLIPRPETELLVETVLDLFAADSPSKARRLLDLGTGSGAIALALASEKSHWHCLGVDRSAAALALAEKNRQHLQLHNLTFRCSDWFSAVAAETFDVIVSNPPYLGASDPHLTRGDVQHEPRSALVAKNNGLADIENIISQSAVHLLPDGWLLIEHGYDQADAVATRFTQAGYVQIQQLQDLGGNPRVTLGRRAEFYDER